MASRFGSLRDTESILVSQQSLLAPESLLQELHQHPAAAALATPHKQQQEQQRQEESDEWCAAHSPEKDDGLTVSNPLTCCGDSREPQSASGVFQQKSQQPSEPAATEHMQVIAPSAIFIVAQQDQKRAHHESLSPRYGRVDNASALACVFSSDTFGEAPQMPNLSTRIKGRSEFI